MRLLLILLITTSFGFSQDKDSIVDIQQLDLSTACGYYENNTKYTPRDICRNYGYQSTIEGEEYIEKMMAHMGLQMNFLVLECPSIRNAFAVNLPSKDESGQIRYIVYDGKWFERLQNKEKKDWIAASILAHEIGHHLNSHTLDGKGSRPSQELEADEFSGFAMYKLGASLEQAKEAMAKISNEKGSDTHPAKALRLNAIKKGWENAEAYTKKYAEISRNTDYTTIALKWFMRAYNIKGNMEQDHINRVAYYGKATEFRADYAAAYRNRAKYLNILGLHKEALQDANRAISIDRDGWNAYSEKGIAYFELGEYNKSIQSFSIAIDGNPENRPYDLAGRAWAYYYQGEYLKAKNDLELALNQKPEWSDAEDKLSKVLIKLKYTND